MAVSDTDLLLVQRGTVPYKTTADALASYSNSKIELGLNKDVPIASTTQLGVIKVGANLDIEADGTLNAVIPAGLTYKGVWTDETTPPAPAANGDFYIWDGADGVTLNNALWGAANGETVNNGDRLFYDGTSWAVVGGGGGGGLTEITGAAPVVVSPVVDGEQEVSMPEADASTDGYMPKEAWEKLDGIEAGAEANVDPTQVYAAAPANGTLTLTPGGDTTVIPLVDTTNAGLMSPTDKETLDNLVASPGGVLSLVAGDGIEVNTTAAPGSAGTPEVGVKFAGTGADASTLVMPANLQLLEDLP
jgi:hypothetical protein